MNLEPKKENNCADLLFVNCKETDNRTCSIYSCAKYFVLGSRLQRN